mmetsp:Transcript_8468/g.20374  ORF Transcript_8468/g.20374 Transcript_8468/m.20374 type:complete len:216 (+) Transcript_8468:573-1220(+)
MMETIPVSTASEAACMASPRALVILTPSAKEMAPEKQRAEYSPKLKPIAQVASSSASCPFSSFSFSTAAMEATKIAGWEMTVESSFSLGPSVQTSKRSYPRISEASSKRALAAGTSLQTSPHIPTNWAPWPGNMKATFDEKSSKSLSLAANFIAFRLKLLVAGANALEKRDAESNMMEESNKRAIFVGMVGDVKVCSFDLFVSRTWNLPMDDVDG